jgi:hypothetical protein
VDGIRSTGEQLMPGILVLPTLLRPRILAVPASVGTGAGGGGQAVITSDRETRRRRRTGAMIVIACPEVDGIKKASGRSTTKTKITNTAGQHDHHEDCRCPARA